MSNLDTADKTTIRVRDLLLVGVSVAAFCLIVLPYILDFNYENQMEASIAMGMTFLASLTSFTLSKIFPQKTFEFAKYEFLFYTISVGAVLHYLDYLNGNLIFIYGLITLGAAYFLNARDLIYIAGVSAIFVTTDYFLIVNSGQDSFSAKGVVFMLLRILYLVLLAQVGKNLGTDLSAQRKQYEKMRKLNKQLNELDKIKGEFIDVASHQLKTPLTVVRGNVSMILEGDYGNVDGNILKPLTEVDIGAQKLSKIVDSVVDTFKFEKDMPLILNPKITNLETLIRSEVESFLPESWAKNTRTYIFADKDIHPILIDIEKIKLVLTIYLENAIRHSLRNGRVEISLNQNKGKVIVEVCDYGPQIANEKTDKLFHRYTKPKKTCKEYLEKAGLNLYVAKRIVESHKGTVYYKPNENGGNIFGFELPAERIEKKNKKRISIK